MSEFRHRTPFRIVALAMFTSLLGSYGCASWQTQSPPLAPHVEEGPNRVRLTLEDGRTLEMMQPTLSNDSIWGSVSPKDGGAAFAFGAPLDQVGQMEVYRFSWTRLALGILGAGTGLFGVALATVRQ